MTSGHSVKRGLLALACMSLAVSALPAAEIDKYLPADTEIVIHVNVRQILDAELVKKYGLEPLRSALAGSGMHEVITALGLDPLKDVKTVTIAGPGGDRPEKNLIVVHGTFDTERLQAAAVKLAKAKNVPLKIHELKGHKIYETTPLEEKGQKDAMFIALPDPDTIVLAAVKDYLVEALDRRAAKKDATLKKDLVRLIEKVDARQSLWLVGLKSGLGGAALNSDEKAKEILDKLESFSTGLTVAGDVKFEVVLAARNAAAADDLKKELSTGLDQARGGIAFIIQNRPELAPLAEVLDAVKIGVQGSALVVKSNVSTSIIDKVMKLAR